MVKTDFKLTIEPQIHSNPVCFYGGLEGLLGININGIEVLEDEKAKTQKEAIGYTIKWILENFLKYVSEGMPKEMTPAVDLYDDLDKITEKYYDICRERGKFKSASLRPDKRHFGNWLYSHILDYGYLNLPIVFQSRRNLMEISWRFNSGGYYKNEEGCEYIPLEDFKKEILNTTEQGLRKIKASGKVFDYHKYEEEFLKLLEQAKAV